VTLTDRDKKLLSLLLPVALIAAYWFLLYAPKREESAAVQQRVEQAQSEQQSAEMQAASLSGAKTGFASDYTTVIRLGKAVPSTVDMPSLLVQLDRAARGTGINFDKIATGERQAAPVAATPTADGNGNDPNAQSGSGKTVEAATDAKAKEDAAAAAAQGQPTTAGGTPAAPAAAGGATTGAAGLESVPLDFTFTGTFYDLADFLHRMKRFVKVVNDDIVVRGRLITIDSLNWKSEADIFPKLTAEVHATVYLAPKAEGVSAGATPQGPGATPAPVPAGGTTPAPTSPPATTAPAATVK
jgi:Tfp pilus assembly protein PilO